MHIVGMKSSCEAKNACTFSVQFQVLAFSQTHLLKNLPIIPFGSSMLCDVGLIVNRNHLPESQNLQKLSDAAKNAGLDSAPTVANTMRKSSIWSIFFIDTFVPKRTTVATTKAATKSHPVTATTLGGGMYGLGAGFGSMTRSSATTETSKTGLTMASLGGKSNYKKFLDLSFSAPHEERAIGLRATYLKQIRVKVH